MLGLIIVSLKGGHLLYHKAFVRNFGLPDPEGGAGALRLCSCGVEHEEELSLGAFVFAVSSFASDVAEAAPTPEAPPEMVAAEAAAAAPEVAEAGGPSVPALTHYQVGDVRMHFWKADAAGVLAVVFVRPGVPMTIGGWWADEIGQQFVAKFADRLAAEEDRTRGFGGFKKPLAATLHKLVGDGIRVVEEAKPTPECPDWILCIYTKPEVRPVAPLWKKSSNADAQQVAQPVARLFPFGGNSAGSPASERPSGKPSWIKCCGRNVPAAIAAVDVDCKSDGAESKELFAPDAVVTALRVVAGPCERPVVAELCLGSDDAAQQILGVLSPNGAACLMPSRGWAVPMSQMLLTAVSPLLDLVGAIGML